MGEKSSPAWNEAERIAALMHYDILDTPREPDFDDVVRIAAHVCNVPVAAVSLVAEDRQWFKAETGFGRRETPLDVSICKEAILQPGLLVVPDTTKDRRFESNELVTGEPHFRFYAGATLETPDGLPLGTVCVLDHKPRELTPEQAATLRALARQVMAQLELRRSVREAHQRTREARRYAEQLQALARAALQITSAGTLDATIQEVTRAARDIVGAHQAVVSLTRGPDWSQAINSVSLSDKYAAYDGYTAVPDGSGIYAQVCETNRPMRLTQAEPEAHPHWHGFGKHAAEHPPMRGWLAAPLVGQDGRNLGLVQLSDKADGSEFGEDDEAVLVQLAQLASFAVERAYSEERRRKAEERQRLLTRELHHRVKNSLANVQAMLGSTARSAKSVSQFYSAFTRRVASLAKTHDLLTEDLWQITTLRELLDSEFAPYREDGPDRVTLHGPSVELRSDVAVPLGMAIHELVSNATQHGALSVTRGSVHVTWAVQSPDEVLHLEWLEQGGPPVDTSKPQGFGSRVINRVLALQTGAEVALEHRADGLRAVFDIPLRLGPEAIRHPLRSS